MAVPALAAAALALCAAPASAAITPTSPVLPNQSFQGEVNGSPLSPAVIETTCAGPVTPGETGTPRPGQTIEVTPLQGAASPNVGFTGPDGYAIIAELVSVSSNGATATAALGIFSEYSQPIPIATTLRVPCSGNATLYFLPDSDSQSAVPATMEVTFGGLP